MEKYLSIKIAGHEYLAAFKNNKTKPTQPDYKADGVAVWVKEYEPKQKDEDVELNEIEI